MKVLVSSSINPLIDPETNTLFKSASHYRRRNLVEVGHSGVCPGNFTLSLASPSLFLFTLSPCPPSPSSSHPQCFPDPWHEQVHSALACSLWCSTSVRAQKQRNQSTVKWSCADVSFLALHCFSQVFVTKLKSCWPEKKRWKINTQRWGLVKVFSSENGLPESRKREHNKGPCFPWWQKASNGLHFLGKSRLSVLRSTQYPAHYLSDPHLTVGLPFVLSCSLP